MGSIDTYIRAAIKKTSAGSPEARNQIYLTAREAIQKLPPEKLDAAMQELFDSVTVIEAEFVQFEMANERPDVIAENRREKFGGLLAKLRLPWITLLSVVIVFAIIVFSIFLLVTEYQKAGIDLTSSQDSSEPITSAKLIFSISSREDLSNLASNPRGTRLIEESELARPAGLWFQNILKVYGKELITIEKGELYLVQLAIQYEPKSDSISLSAGFSSAENDLGKIQRSMFLHRGRVRAKSYRKNQNDYSFSSIVTWEDISKDLDFNSSKASIRPMILARSKNPDTEILIKSFSIDKLF
ncbi:MAG: hypothetical protein ACR2O3_04295 [Rhizobiaceae bacterium]